MDAAICRWTSTCALPWDAATFQFQKGTLTMLRPVNGIVTGAIFIGEGHFNLKPVIPIDARELSRRTGAAEVNEDFTEAVFRFTGDARLKFLPGLGDRTEPASQEHRAGAFLPSRAPQARGLQHS